MLSHFRRSIVLLLLAHWLIPTGIAVAVLGHQLLHHGLLHHGSSHLAEELCDELTHGHRHDDQAPEHDHLVIRDESAPDQPALALAAALVPATTPRHDAPPADPPLPGGSRCRSSPLFTADCSLLL